MSRTGRVIEGISIGHASDFRAATGVTVILCPGGMTPGVDMRGSATSTRQIDSLFPHHVVPKVHGICLAGGSAFGLEAGAGSSNIWRRRVAGLVAVMPWSPSYPQRLFLTWASVRESGGPTRPWDMRPA